MFQLEYPSIAEEAFPLTALVEPAPLIRHLDLVLIVIPINHVMDTYKEWQGKGKKRRAPGGPDELWSIEDKEMIFKGLLSKVLSDEKVEKAWGKVRK